MRVADVPHVTQTISRLAPLGQILLKRNLITPQQLAHALQQQLIKGSRLGENLVAEGIIDRLTLYKVLATHYGLDFINLLETPPAPGLLKIGQLDHYLRLCALPWKCENGIMLVATSEPCDALIHWADEQFEHYQLVITSFYDIQYALSSAFGIQIEAESRLTLWQKTPQRSARTLFIKRQKYAAYSLFYLSVVAIIHQPIITLLSLMVLCHVLYSATMLFKCIIFAAGMAEKPPEMSAETPLHIPDHQLPIYTILIPMYREAATMPRLLAALQALDYPISKLDIKLVLEADDLETLNAAIALRPPSHIEIIRVPASDLRTKPKACNYALRFARGDYVTIFDADDKLDKLQLRKACAAFNSASADVVCLQAQLNYDNANANWLTRFFSLEYTMLFNMLLPGLQRLGIPIPLGGTSNHLCLKRLRAIGEWDPYNVTEDADLGIRISALGFRTIMLNSLTMEEAPISVSPWIKQRSRWIKGYMQTWIVHMRQPLTLWRQLGSRGMLGFQFFVGLSCFCFLTAPLMWVFSGSWLLGHAQTHDGPISFIYRMAAINLLLNMVIHWVCALSAAKLYNRFRRAMIIAAFFYPIYLIFHSLASYRALWQLWLKPHFWDKTMHGLLNNQETEQHSGELLRLGT